MDIKGLIDVAISKFEMKGYKYVDEQARLLVAHICNKSVADLNLHYNVKISNEQYSWFNELINKCLKTEIPIQYLIGYTYFNNMRFNVSRDTILPDSVSELLVNTVLKYIKHDHGLNIIDIGTGTGIIAISLAKQLENAKIYASDISTEALNIAKTNCTLNNVENRVTLVESNLLDKLYDYNLKNSIDILVSNPPYVKSSSIAQLPVQVRDYSPMIALDGKDDGLYFYKEILEQAVLFLKSNSYIFFELEEPLADGIKYIVDSNPNYNLLEIIKSDREWGWVAILQKK